MKRVYVQWVDRAAIVFPKRCPACGRDEPGSAVRLHAYRESHWILVLPWAPSRQAGFDVRCCREHRRRCLRWQHVELVSDVMGAGVLIAGWIAWPTFLGWVFAFLPAAVVMLTVQCIGKRVWRPALVVVGADGQDISFAFRDDAYGDAFPSTLAALRVARRVILFSIPTLR